MRSAMFRLGAGVLASCVVLAVSLANGCNTTPVGIFNTNVQNGGDNNGSEGNEPDDNGENETHGPYDLNDTWVVAGMVTNGDMTFGGSGENVPLETFSVDMDIQNDTIVRYAFAIINGMTLPTEVPFEGSSEVASSGEDFTLEMVVVMPETGLAQGNYTFEGTFINDNFAEGTFTLTNRYVEGRDPAVQSAAGTFTMARD